MVRNDDRRRDLADAGLSVLAREGARGLTHRAVDHEAGVPTGTASNYFRSRDALIAALVERIGQRLAPDPATLPAPLAALARERDLVGNPAGLPLADHVVRPGHAASFR